MAQIAADLDTGVSAAICVICGSLSYRREMDRHSEDRKDPQTYAIIGCAMEVHRELGSGFLERVYHDALAEEFSIRGVPALREHPVPIFYKDLRLTCSYRADFICFESILVELKAVTKLSPLETAQTLHYLKATGLHRAILLNFATPRLDYRRFVHTHLRSSA